MTISHKPTQKNKDQVAALSAFGISREDIAYYLGVGYETLVKYYERQLHRGRIDTTVRVAKNVVRQATKDDFRAFPWAKLYLASHAGWKENALPENVGQINLQNITINLVRPSGRAEEARLTGNGHAPLVIDNSAPLADILN